MSLSDDKVIDVYTIPESPAGRPVVLLLKALGVKYNIKKINLMAGEHLKPEFLKMNPLHTIPVINDNGFILYESHVIMKYLVDQYGKNDSLYPKDSKKQALVSMKCYFCATNLFPRFRNYFCPTIVFGKLPQPEAANELNETLQQLNNFLDNEMFIAGQHLTVPDFTIIGVIATIDATEQFDLKSYQNLWMWYQRARRVMESYGYEEINHEGAKLFAKAFKKKLSEIDN